MCIAIVPLLVDVGVKDPISGTGEMRRQMRLVFASIAIVLSWVEPVMDGSLNLAGFWKDVFGVEITDILGANHHGIEVGCVTHSDGTR